jgi:hypothetical protein
MAVDVVTEIVIDRPRAEVAAYRRRSIERAELVRQRDAAPARPDAR